MSSILPLSPNRAPQNERVLIVGLARNVAGRIERNVKRLQAAAAIFGDVQTLVIESDSSDNTVDQLQKMANSATSFRFRSLGNLRKNHPVRCERLAICRNAYLDELRDNPAYRDVTHLIVSDMDGVSRHLTSSALASCWHQHEPWSACTANQADFYYDVWTLRHPVWCPGDCWQEYQRLLPIVGKRVAKELTVYSRMIHVHRNAAMIEVESAFGGLAVYKREAILEARYRGVRPDGTEVCEHVALCEQMRAAGHRIFLNPALINAKRTSHSGGKKWFRRLRRNLLASVVGDDFGTETRIKSVA